MILFYLIKYEPKILIIGSTGGGTKLCIYYKNDIKIEAIYCYKNLKIKSFKTKK